MALCTQDYLSRRHAMLQQGSPRPPRSGSAHTVSDVQGASTRPSDDDEKPSLNLNDDFKEVFAFTGLLDDSGKRGFTPTTTSSR